MTFNHLNFNNDVTYNCISRIPIHYHRTLALTSHTMRSFIATKDFFNFRSAQGLTQPIIYCSFRKNQTHNWYSLGLKPKKMKTSPSCKKYFLMKIPMDLSYFPASSKTVATAGSKLFMMGTMGIEQESDQYTKLMILNCWSHTWSLTSPMKHARKIKNLFCCAIQEKIFVVGGCEEEVGPLNVKVEIYSPISDSWKSVPHLVLDKNNNFCFPSKFKDYTHTSFVGKLIIRVMDTLLLWYDDEDSMEWIPVDGYARLKSVPFNVVDYGGNLLVFGKVKSEKTSLWATEINLRKADRKVFAVHMWLDTVLRSANVVDVCSTCIEHYSDLTLYFFPSLFNFNFM